MARRSTAFSLLLLAFFFMLSAKALGAGLSDGSEAQGSLPADNVGDTIGSADADAAPDAAPIGSVSDEKFSPQASALGGMGPSSEASSSGTTTGTTGSPSTEPSGASIVNLNFVVASFVAIAGSFVL